MVCLIFIGSLLAYSSLTFATVTLKVGLYNHIPDLQNDELASYKNLVERGFNSHSHQVNVVIKKNEYNPYGPIDEYLKSGAFDLIEIDTASLMDVVDKQLIVNVDFVMPISADTLATAKAAVHHNGKDYGYPSLVCGNFIIGFSLHKEDTCPLKEGRNNFKAFQKVVTKCKTLIPPFERLIGGQMFGSWYLPFVYLDAYIDVNGKNTVHQAVADLKKEIVDKTVCNNLKWFLGLFNSKDYKSKCKEYNTVQLINDLDNLKIMHYFGFSEISAMVCKRQPYAAISWPLGPETHMIQFTDALVVSQAAWLNADEKKKNAIRAFIKYFTGKKLRGQIANGEDLDQKRSRYLLPATKTFYNDTKDSLYKDIYSQLQNSITAPPLSHPEIKKMNVILENALIENCGVKQK